MKEEKILFLKKYQVSTLNFILVAYKQFLCMDKKVREADQNIAFVSMQVSFTYLYYLNIRKSKTHF
jgi:hypothetical protein